MNYFQTLSALLLDECRWLSQIIYCIVTRVQLPNEWKIMLAYALGRANSRASPTMPQDSISSGCEIHFSSFTFFNSLKLTATLDLKHVCLSINIEIKMYCIVITCHAIDSCLLNKWNYLMNNKQTKYREKNNNRLKFAQFQKTSR